MKVSVVIPNYNHFPLVNELLISLRDRTDVDEIIVADDASTDRETYAGLSWWEKNGVTILRHASSKSIGFLRNSNFGLKYATGDVICLLSTDVIVEDNLSRVLKNAIATNPNRLVGGIVYSGSTGWNLFGQTVFPYAEGWLLACTRDWWDKLGYFDERYSPNDFEDVDLSTTAIKLGMELYSLNNHHIRHIGAQSIGYNEQREELTKQNRKKFEEKWITKSSGNE